jgi:tetratricopeptide (TPR) repeat protein
MSRWSNCLTTLKSRPKLLISMSCLVLAVGIGVLGAWYLWPNVWLALAEQALQQNDPLTARSYLDRYHARRPGDANALLLLAKAARHSDDYASAERYLAEYDKAGGPRSSGGLEWELLGAQQGDLAGSEDGLKSAVRNNSPDTIEILEALAKGYIAAYRLPEAVKMIDYLLQLDKTYVPAVILRGKLLDRVRQLERAETELRQAVEMDPKNPDAHGALAAIQNRRGYTDEAIANYQAALRAKPGDPALLLGLARTYLDAAELVEVGRTLDQVLAAHPDNVDALVEKGRLLLRQKRPAEAEPLLGKAASLAPWHREAQRLRVLALKEIGNTEQLAKAQQRLDELVAQDAEVGKLRLRARDNPGDPGVRMDLWRWSERNGQLEEGLSWLTEILKTTPQHAQAQAALADYFDRMGQPRRAAEHRAGTQSSFR